MLSNLLIKNAKSQSENYATFRRSRHVSRNLAKRRKMVAIQIPDQRDGEADVAGRVPGRRLGRCPRQARGSPQAGRRWYRSRRTPQGREGRSGRKYGEHVRGDRTRVVWVVFEALGYRPFREDHSPTRAQRVPVYRCATRQAITAPELLAVLRRVESRGANETAHRAMQVCGRVFRYAVATGRAERDPSRGLGRRIGAG